MNILCNIVAEYRTTIFNTITSITTNDDDN